MDRQNVVCTIEHYLVLKRNEILTYATRINLEDITQNEIIVYESTFRMPQLSACVSPEFIW